MLSEHWAEGAGGRRPRALRVPIINAVLGHYGLQFSDVSGSMYVVRDLKGRAAVVSDLAMLWQEAERLAGRALDPLDPSLVASLSRNG